jgi:hypothetical protein
MTACCAAGLQLLWKACVHQQQLLALDWHGKPMGHLQVLLTSP